MKLAPKSLKAWIQGRRKDVASLALTTKRSLSSLSAGDADLDQESLRKRARSLAGDSFGSARQKAAAKLDAKARARQYEAQRSNQLVASETVPEKEFQTMLEKQRSNDDDQIVHFVVMGTKHCSVLLGIGVISLFWADG